MEHNELSELADLYTFGILVEEDRDVAARLAEIAELGEMVEPYESAFAAIAYAAPAVPVPAGLKQRLFESLEDVSGPPTSTELLQDLVLATPMSVKQLTELRWKPYLVPGVQVARLHVDKQKREITYLMRVEAGVCLPVHRHAQVEEIVVVEGDLWIDQEIYRQGDYLRSWPGSQHSPHTHGGCLAFVRTSLDDEVLV
jgi:hypothetical protein